MQQVIQNAITESYGKNEVVLLIKDRSTLYCYWEVSQEKKQMIEEFFRCNWDDLPKYIHLNEVTLIDFNGDNSNEKWMIRVENHSNNWFIHHIKDQGNYCVDYGVMTKDGRLFSILRSNVVKFHQQNDIKRDYVQVKHQNPDWIERFNGYSLSDEKKLERAEEG